MKDKELYEIINKIWIPFLEKILKKDDSIFSYKTPLKGVEIGGNFWRL
jgi:hypothetical protein